LIPLANLGDLIFIIVEVLIFGIVAVGCTIILNKSIQRSVEISFCGIKIKLGGSVKDQAKKRSK
jgi:hypothetical protein